MTWHFNINWIYLKYNSIPNSRVTRVDSAVFFSNMIAICSGAPGQGGAKWQ